MQLLKTLEKRVGDHLNENGLDSALVFASEAQFEKADILIVLRKSEDVNRAITNSHKQALSELATEILQRSKYLSHSVHVISEVDFNRTYQGSTYNWSRR